MQFGDLKKLPAWQLEHEAFVLRVEVAADFLVQRDGAHIEENGLADAFAETLVHFIFEISLPLCLSDSSCDIETGGNFALKDSATELRERCGCACIVSRCECVEHPPYDRVVESAVGVESAIGEKPHQRVMRIESVNITVVFELKRELVEKGAQEGLHRFGGFVKVDVLVQVVARQQKLLRGAKRLVREAEDVSSFGMGNPNIVHDPIRVESGFADAGHVSVSHHIVEAVGVEGSGDDCVIHVVWRLCANDFSDVVRVESTVF